MLGNVTFLERPFHPTTLVSLARTALRGAAAAIRGAGRLEACARARRVSHLFENIDQGFCIIEFRDGPLGPLSDYIHVEQTPLRHACRHPERRRP